ncbi:protein CYSTEINE-RICH TRANSMEMBRANE MODULE 9-like isoform X2 [Quercus robur]|uniref:protein CYSTEINE-RICH TRANSMEMBRANE MODULE 9-like isoform X2 n=1 Tax=Quercus robur TaxID=38942 RepID=UPI002163BB0F|nr:protein CYSTEINE-RICH TRANSMEMBRANE MODULE 9-like isoform X2 [Quercus robur]
MSCFEQNQFEATAIRPYAAAPPLIVIPMKDIHAYPQNSPLPPPSPPPVEIKTRGEEFWKGCWTDLCCCHCCLDFWF